MLEVNCFYYSLSCYKLITNQGFLINIPVYMIFILYLFYFSFSVVNFCVFFFSVTWMKVIGEETKNLLVLVTYNTSVAGTVTICRDKY